MANDGTVKIGVEFSKNDIQKGYKTIQDEAKKTANSLKSVNDALKLDPKNTDLLIEKQKLLTKVLHASLQRLLREPIREVKRLDTEEEQEEYRRMVGQLFRI